MRSKCSKKAMQQFLFSAYTHYERLLCCVSVRCCNSAGAACDERQSMPDEFRTINERRKIAIRENCASEALHTLAERYLNAKPTTRKLRDDPTGGSPTTVHFNCLFVVALFVLR